MILMDPFQPGTFSCVLPSLLKSGNGLQILPRSKSCERMSRPPGRAGDSGVASPGATATARITIHTGSTARPARFLRYAACGGAAGEASGDAGATHTAVSPVTAPGHVRGPEGSALPGHEPRQGALRVPREGKGGALCHHAGPVPPGVRPAAMATPARPGTAERPQRPRAGMERLPGCPAASLIGCHAVGTAHLLPF